jgi:dihydroxyacetone synthase
VFERKWKHTDRQAEDEILVLNTVRCLAADLCQEVGWQSSCELQLTSSTREVGVHTSERGSHSSLSGHPGTVMGAASIGVALWRYLMRYNPSNPAWFARDRFVLSAGHACLLQYLMLHFSGYEAWTLEEIRNYHAPTMNGIAAGHPEIEFPGVEVIIISVGVCVLPLISGHNGTARTRYLQRCRACNRRKAARLAVQQAGVPHRGREGVVLHR